MKSLHLPALHLPALLLAALPVLALAQTGERERVAAERRAVSDRFAAEERACRQRFAVTACVDDVRIRRREALTPFRERELRIDEAERRQRAQDRQAALASKRNAAAQRAPGPPDPELRIRSAPASAPPADPAVPRHHSDEASRAAQAAERARASAQRVEAAEATQAEIAKRLAERATRGKTSAPLPIPAAASAARK